jgi:predicted nucleic acid-binding protein
MDSSAIVAALLGNATASGWLRVDDVRVPHLVDSEVAQALRRYAREHDNGEARADTALKTWRYLGVARHAAHGLLDRIWALRENVTAYDATYVALAEALGCPLVTADARLARAPGPRCEMVVVRV